jgi:hypothetical protein
LRGCTLHEWHPCTYRGGQPPRHRIEPQRQVAQPLGAFAKLDVGDDVTEKVLLRNAERLLGL